MHLIAIDPHTSDIGLAVAEFHNNLLVRVVMVSQEELFKNKAVALTDDTDRILVTEGQYAGPGAKDTPVLSRLCGRIEQHFISQGFQTVVAPVFGPKSWQAVMLGQNGRVPGRKQAKILSLKVAKSVWPRGFKFSSDHLSDSALIGLWWLDQQRRGGRRLWSKQFQLKK